ncbi:hypothetical protein [Liquorilactobacillus sicerae]|nr:hypothetical protein [Liquorilactobacillus sicerae]
MSQLDSIARLLQIKDPNINPLKLKILELLVLALVIFKMIHAGLSVAITD